jgi:hypothetical protein
MKNNKKNKMSFISVATKSGAIYYYRVDKNGKKTRVRNSDVPDNQKAVIIKSLGKQKLEKPKSVKKTEKKIKKPSKEVKKTKKSKVEPLKKSIKVEYGKIRIGQHQRAKMQPVYPNFEKITAWSRGKWKDLSPFYIGGVEYVDVDGEKEVAPIFENFWQGHKVWDKVARQKQKVWEWPSESHIKDDMPNEKWMKWHKALINHDEPVRRPNGRAVPKYAWWRDQKTGKLQKLNTVESRRKIYIPFLKDLYRKSASYKKLLAKVKAGQNIMLIEPDGPLLDAYPEGREMTLDLLNNLVEKMNYKDEGFPERYAPFGHGYVIAMCILEDLEK